MINKVTRAEAKAQGLAHFYDGAPCRKGHLSSRRVSNGECMECARIRAREYYEVNAEAVRKKAAAKYAENAEHAGKAKARAAKRRKSLDPHVLRASEAAYYAANRDAIKDRSRRWSAANRERKKATNLAWNKANPEQARRHQRSHEKRRRERDPVYAMAERIGSAIRQSLINSGYTKRNRVHDIIGCTFADFAVHIERQFPRGMSWQNRSEWHIDHIIPIASAKTEADVLRLHHFTNLRPLWAHENATKSNKLELLL